jgi:hypothetical protein
MSTVDYKLKAMIPAENSGVDTMKRCNSKQELVRRELLN